jgi:hypothetical protein
MLKHSSTKTFLKKLGQKLGPHSSESKEPVVSAPVSAGLLTKSYILRNYNVPNSVAAAVMKQHNAWVPFFSGNWAELLFQDHRIGKLDLVKFFKENPDVQSALETILENEPRHLEPEDFPGAVYYILKRMFDIIGGAYVLDGDQWEYQEAHKDEV